MSRKSGVSLRSLQPLIGSVIGVGIFGLPYVFAQAGFTVGLIHLFIVLIVNTVVLLAYGDIIMNTSGHPRFTGIVQRYAGDGWGWLATIAAFGAAWGAMVAYIIVGGEFLHALLSPALGGSVIIYNLIFFSVSAGLLIGGLGFISRLEVFFVFGLLLALFVILTGSLPYVQLEYLTETNLENWFLPFGVLLFAYGGMAAIPEMAHVLGRKKYQLRKWIIIGLGIITVVYISFSAVVVAVTGTSTSEEAILGLGEFVGSWITVLGSIVGLTAVFTSFLILGISVTETMVHDFKWRYLNSWALAAFVPLVVFLLGAKSFIDVVGYTGGILGGIMGLLALYTYVQAKRDVCTPKRCLRIPHWLLVIASFVFVIGILLTIFGIGS